MKTPGSPNWVAPRTRNSIASKVLPQPALPQTSVGRPRGRPPPVISSSPSMPVGALGSERVVALLLAAGLLIFPREARQRLGIAMSIAAQMTTPKHPTGLGAHYRVTCGATL